MASNSPAGSGPEFIDHSSADIAEEPHIQSQEDTDTPPRPPTLSRASTASRDRCWICLATKDEDDPSPPNPPLEWRSPCSCSLQAHEACLLDWVADQESPQSRSGRSRTIPDKILCPQCRSEIKIQRPVDPIVELCKRIDKQYSRLILPGLATSVVGTLFSGCWTYGRLATYLVFGPEHDRQIFQYALASGHGRVASYALIPLSLIFSRTSYADFVLPVGTVTLLSTQLPPTIDGPYIAWDGPWWPPLPSTVFIILPTLKSFYDWTYEKCFGQLNQKWLQAIMPRHEDDYTGRADNIPDILNEGQAAAEEEAPQADDIGGVVLEFEVNLGQMGDGRADADMPALENANAAGNGPEAENHPQRPNNNGEGGRGRINEYITDTQKIFGSLLLPVAAAISGEVFKYLLPYSWISPRWNYYPDSRRVGFFATKWGRSVAGGLALCVLKDMVLMYCRWRLADSHRKRKVMNFDKIKKEYVSV